MVWFTQITTAEETGKSAFYENSDATAFLSDSTSELLFICGLKGVGKTLLLRHKSAALRKNLQGVQFVPETELAETFTANLVSWSETRVGRLSNWTVWQAIWRTVLATVVAKRAAVQLPHVV